MNKKLLSVIEIIVAIFFVVFVTVGFSLNKDGENMDFQTVIKRQPVQTVEEVAVKNWETYYNTVHDFTIKRPKELEDTCFSHSRISCFGNGYGAPYFFHIYTFQKTEEDELNKDLIRTYLQQYNYDWQIVEMSERFIANKSFVEVILGKDSVDSQMYSYFIAKDTRVLQINVSIGWEEHNVQEFGKLLVSTVEFLEKQKGFSTYRNDGLKFEFKYPDECDVGIPQYFGNLYHLSLETEPVSAGGISIVSQKNEDIETDIYNDISEEQKSLATRETYYVEDIQVGNYSVIRAAFLSEAAYLHKEVVSYIKHDFDGKYIQIHTMGSNDYNAEELADILIKDFKFLSSGEVISGWDEYTNEKNNLKMNYPSVMEETIQGQYHEWNFSVASIDEIRKRYKNHEDAYCPSDASCRGLDDEVFLEKQFEMLREVSELSSLSEELKKEINDNFVLFSAAIDSKKRIESIHNENLGIFGIKMIGYDGYDVSADNFYYRVGFIVGDKVIKINFDLFPRDYSIEESDSVRGEFRNVKKNGSWVCRLDNFQDCLDWEEKFIDDNIETCSGGYFDPIIARYDLIAKSISLIED